MTDRTPFQLFRNLDPATEAALRESIDRFGVLVPVAKDQHGNILDGHQRVRIADELGVKYPTNIIEVADEAEALEIARTLNEDRRAMPKAERLGVEVALREDGHSLRAIAGAVGVDEKQVRRDLRGADMSAPASGPTTPAYVLGRDGKRYPARKVPKPPADETLKLAAELNRQRLEERRKRHIDEGRASVPPPSFDSPSFRVIYADPPWRYDQSGLVSADWGMADDHYPTMSLEDLKAIPVPDMALPDSVLFLWATSPMLPAALELMSAWGFQYKSSLVWDKGRPFLGSYVHISHELLLIGTRGSCVADVKHTSGSVIAIPRSAHSRKPDEFRELIDSMYVFGNRIELFCRGAVPDGWQAWGNEVLHG